MKNSYQNKNSITFESTITGTRNTQKKKRIILDFIYHSLALFYLYSYRISRIQHEAIVFKINRDILSQFSII